MSGVANQDVASISQGAEDFMYGWGGALLDPHWWVNATLAIGGGILARAPVPLSVATPHGFAVQSMTSEALALRSQVENGALIYRAGEFGIQNTTSAQFWPLQNPAGSLDYVGQMGMPGAPTINWIMGSRIDPTVQFITRPAPGIGLNAGGNIEAVVLPGDARINWFHMPD